MKYLKELSDILYSSYKALTIIFAVFFIVGINTENTQVLALSFIGVAITLGNFMYREQKKGSK